MEKTFERTYNAYLKKDVNLSNVIELDDNTDLSGELACSGGQCEIDVDMDSLKKEMNEA